jgi:FkbM family methyltransferase
MYYLKQAIKGLVNLAGFDLRRITPNANPAYQLLLGLDRFNIDIVFDVGANAGQFATELRTVGYRGEIVSFEPLSDASALLAERARRDPKWQVHRRGAIGDYDGEIEINVSANSVSSSVLPMMEAHAAAATDSAYIALEKVPIFKLDSIASEYLAETSRLFIKIDTQGFEWQVLDGATETISRAQGVLCELSLVPLYEGQRLWRDIIQRLESEGFVLWSIQLGFTDPRDGRTLQLDAIFFKDH